MDLIKLKTLKTLTMAFKTYSEGGNTLANQIKTASTKISNPLKRKHY